MRATDWEKPAATRAYTLGQMEGAEVSRTGLTACGAETIPRKNRRPVRIGSPSNTFGPLRQPHRKAALISAIVTPKTLSATASRSASVPVR